MLYGTGYIEIQWDEGTIKQEQLSSVEGMGKEYMLFSSQDLDKNFQAEELVKLKRERKIKPAIVTADLAKDFRAMLNTFEEIEKESPIKALSDDITNLTNLVSEVEVAAQKGLPLKTTTVQKGRSKRVLGLKPLDPIYMRIRRDAWANEYGYIQWIAFPPAIIDTDAMICIKYHPQSWGYECAYGTSQIMPLIKNNDLLMQFENDAATWMHLRAVPPLIIQGGGDPTHPYTTPQMQDLMSKLAVRNSASMFFIKSDVQVKEIVGVARNMNVSWWLDYLMMRRYQALGVPPMMMGASQGASRSAGATGEVIYQDFITRLQMLQEFISDSLIEKLFIPLLMANAGDLGLTEKDLAEKPVIIWKPIVEEDRNMRAQRIVQMVQVGSVTKNQLREEMGFKRVDVGDKDYDPSLDQYLAAEPKQVPTGRPPTQSGFSPTNPTGKAGNTGAGDAGTRDTEMTQPMKQETQSVIDTIRSQTDLKDALKKIVVDAKKEIGKGALASNVKKEAMEKAEKEISDRVVQCYVLGKQQANVELKKEEQVSIDKKELPKIVQLKKKFTSDFGKIMDDLFEETA